MRALTLALLALVPLAAGCRSDAPRRARTLARAAQLDESIAAGPVVRALRTPTDTGRIIYDPPTNLALPESAASGSAPVGATGVAAADTSHAPGAGSMARKSTTAPPAPDSAAARRARRRAP